MFDDPIFVDQSGSQPAKLDLWRPVIVRKAQIDAEIARLAAMPRPANGRRRSLIHHPRAEHGRGLTPGIQVTLNVLAPGERTTPFRQNSTQVNFTIQGRGDAVIGAERFDMALFDVCNTPSMRHYWFQNTGTETWAWLTYSNGALLEMMNIHVVEEDPPVVAPVPHEEMSVEDKKRRKSPYGTFQLNEAGAWLMPYEVLINPETVESKALHWPWQQVKGHLDKLEALGKDYVGRRLYMLYNPMTGRTNGITPSFFATHTIRPPRIVDRPHRHSSAAINYYFQGSGRSTVEGEVYEWSAGDLMLSAPGWAVHNHASYDDYVYELTIQDQPLNIFMESLLWQESLKLPPALLGSEEGFGTNRAAG
jgi:gentisate 1,2-dioxygenase